MPVNDDSGYRTTAHGTMPPGGRVMSYTEHWAPREVHTPRADGVTVYYPFALVDLLDCHPVDDSKDGELLLSFLDEDGCRVSIRMRRELAEALKARLFASPDSSR